jgi:ketosteroid isomerase-like protein
MTCRKSPIELATEWKDACNSYDADRVAALYAEGVVFKSPRVRTFAGEESGILRGKSAVRDYWQKIFERRPNLNFSVGHVFAGADSVALEYRVGDLYGIEFMTVDAEGLVTFAAGNDVVRQA